MKKLTVLFASALLALALVAPASAAPVSEWNWAYNAGFVFWSDTGSATGFNINTAHDTTLEWDLPAAGGPEVRPQTLYWGTRWDDEARAQVELGLDDNPSRISIEPIDFGDGDYNAITTNGADETVAYLTHYNYEVAGPTLTYGVVRSTFMLTPVPQDPATATDPAYMADLEFYFFETPNNAPDGWVGEWLDEDVFIFASAGLTSQDFWYMGYHYIFNFGGTFAPIPQEYIDHLVYDLEQDLDPEQTYLGWVTPEGATTTFESLVNVTQVVPEPSTFILLGAGLLGLAGIARRRRS